jgi:hypothetical protein
MQISYGMGPKIEIDSSHCVWFEYVKNPHVYG